MEETNTIKGIEVIAYKGMKSDMTCKGFHYEIGKSYKTDKVKLCECGFHACLNPRDVLEYYTQTEGSRYFKVKLSGEITKCDFEDTKVSATEITILEEINIKEVIKTTEWWKNDNVLDLLYWSEDFVRVQRTNGDWNFVNKQGNYLSDEWFNYVDDFYDGFTIVQRTNGEYNFINKKGKILSNEWFMRVSYFQDGFARVKRTNDEWNFINKKGKILSNEWFEFVGDFKDGLAVGQRTNGEYFKIDKQGKIVVVSK